MKKKYWMVTYVREVDDDPNPGEFTGIVYGGIHDNQADAEQYLDDWLNEDCETEAKCYQIVEMDLTEEELETLRNFDDDESDGTW